MRAFLLLASVAGASAQGGLQALVDQVFEKYLPAAQSGRACPFERISQQCELLNNTMAEVRACHRACGHGEFECHLKCPKSRPTSVRQLAKLAESMLCHTACGEDRECHRTRCTNPFEQNLVACGKLAEVVECHRTGGDHSTCHLDGDAKELLLQEPWSLAKDVADHIVDHLLPANPERQVTKEEVRSCHQRCGWDRACHKGCPKGPWGVLKEQCETLNTTSACHHSCKEQNIKCPFQKASCHMKCPHMMPSSLRELKMTVEHMACHADCGAAQECHRSCPLPELWVEKRTKCAELDAMMACHKNCRGQERGCHYACESFQFRGRAVNSMLSPPGQVVKEAVSTLLI